MYDISTQLSETWCSQLHQSGVIWKWGIYLSDFMCWTCFCHLTFDALVLKTLFSVLTWPSKNILHLNSEPYVQPFLGHRTKCIYFRSTKHQKRKTMWAFFSACWHVTAGQAELELTTHAFLLGTTSWAAVLQMLLYGEQSYASFPLVTSHNVCTEKSLWENSSFSSCYILRVNVVNL